MLLRGNHNRIDFINIFKCSGTLCQLPGNSTIRAVMSWFEVNYLKARKVYKFKCGKTRPSENRKSNSALSIKKYNFTYVSNDILLLLMLDS